MAKRIGWKTGMAPVWSTEMRAYGPDRDARWYRFLPSGDSKEQQRVLDKIAERFKKLGGMTPTLERKIGF